MEETKKAKQVSLNPASEKVAKKEAAEKKVSEGRKATYEELNNYCMQLYNQNKQLVEQLQQRDMSNLFRRLDYLFLVLQNKDSFSADFIGDCADEIKTALSPSESSDN